MWSDSRLVDLDVADGGPSVLWSHGEAFFAAGLQCHWVVPAQAGWAFAGQSSGSVCEALTLLDSLPTGTRLGVCPSLGRFSVRSRKPLRQFKLLYVDNSLSRSLILCRQSAMTDNDDENSVEPEATLHQSRPRLCADVIMTNNPIRHTFQ